MNDQREKLEALFDAAAALESDSQRREYLDHACPDAELRKEVEALLEASKNPDSLFAQGKTRAVSNSKADPGLEEPGAQIGRYKLLQKLGEGGFGVVYMAEQKEPVKRRIALKIIKLGMDTRQVVARFEAERQALAMMDHPNIAKVLDAGATESGRPYFVMELVRGVPVTEYCDKNQLTNRERLDLFISVCQAVQHAHQKGVIHRDIKPSNILITLHDGVPVPKIIDFGIAKATQHELTEKTVFTQFHQMIGTPAYMSPEQAEMSGLDIDTRSDIYSLGVLLYELLTGKTPLDGKELLAGGYDEIRRRIKEQEPLKPSTRVATLEGEERTTVARHRHVDPFRLSDELRGDLDWIVMKCLEKDRTRRYETANALALELRRHLASEPVRARPPSSAYRIQKFVRRNRVAVSAAACVVLALVVGLAISTWSLLNERELRRRAVAAEKEQMRLRQDAETARTAESEQRKLAEANARKAAEKEAHARQLLYAADMNLAQQALVQNNVGSASDLLDRHWPGPGEPDLRGWEWRYIWQQCQSDALATLSQRPTSIHSLSISRDGKFLAAGEFLAGGLSIWDLDTRQAINPVPECKGPVLTAFSPREDWLAFTVRESTPTAFRDVVRVWNMASGKVIAEFPVGGHCSGLAFADDGTTLIAARGDAQSSLIICDIPNAAISKRVAAPGLRAGSAERTPFAMAASAKLAAHASTSGTLRVVDLVTGEERWTARAAEETVVTLAFSPDAKILASGAGYGERDVRLWDVDSGKLKARLSGHQGYVRHLLFWPDGKTLASASSDQTIRIWDLANPDQPSTVNVLRGHRQEVWQLALLADNRTLVSGSKDGTILLWDTALTHNARHALTLPAQVGEWCFSEDSKSVLTLDRQGRVRQWSGEQFQQMEPLVEIGTNHFRVQFSDNGRFLATGTSDGVLTVWDLQSRRQMHRLKVDSGPVVPGSISADGKKVRIARFSSNLGEEWDLFTGKSLWSTRLPQHTRFATGSADGRLILVAGAGGEFLLRDALSGADQRPDLGVLWPSSVAFSPDGSRFSVGSYSGFVTLFQTSTLKEMATFRGFLQGVHSVAFSPDGRRLASGGGGFEAVRLWDIETGQPLFTLEAKGSVFNQTAFSPDGNLLGSSSGLGGLHIWRAPSREKITRAKSSETPAGKLN